MNKEDMLSIRDLFTDAAKEVLERNRIKAQMNKILQIVEVDKRRLQKAYAELGKMYVEGTLEENESRVQMLRGFIDHVNDRIRRAKVRYAELEKVHSVDECTQALKDELMVQLKNAKETTTDMARDLGDKAKLKAQDLSDKAKIKAQDLSDKAKKVIKKEKGVELTEGQSAELVSLIEEQIGKEEEISAETAAEKVQEILKSLDIEDISEDAVVEIAAVTTAETQETPAEATEDSKKKKTSKKTTVEAEENFDF